MLNPALALLIASSYCVNTAFHQADSRRNMMDAQPRGQRCRQALPAPAMPAVCGTHILMIHNSQRRQVLQQMQNVQPWRIYFTDICWR